jgi:hypothetical protein
VKVYYQSKSLTSPAHGPGFGLNTGVTGASFIEATRRFADRSGGIV